MNIGLIIIQVVALFMALTFHEFAHGWIARQLGDRTAEAQGRLTLNPKDHIDPFGTLLLPGILIFINSPVVFGWAKPVPINPMNFGNPRKGMMWSALGGPVINLLLAAILVIAFKTMLMLGIFVKPLLLFLIVAIQLNLFLAVFNLIPIPPLDGGRVMVGLLPPKQAMAYSKIEPYGFMIVILLMYFNILDRFLFYPIVTVLRFLGIA
ncbi:MAG: site-2 protease family protein [Deltaproteobacteria bacterium]|nr:site-2 protease family protein [Deltaproteobacteria bacterium]